MKYIKSLVLALLLSVVSLAQTVSLTQTQFSYNYGGEFAANNSGLDISAYAKATSSGSAFQTFCVQVNTEFILGQDYSYQLSNFTSFDRGTGIIPLTWGAAELYAEFAAGTLKGYDYINGDRLASAGELQTAIWRLQGDQRANGSFNQWYNHNQFYDYIIGLLGDSATKPNNFDLTHVEVLQLWDKGYDIPAQNQLYLAAPIPEASTWIAVAALILVIAIAWTNRKKSS